MTQHELIINFIQRYGEIIPAKMKGTEFAGGFFGSETPKRCRELWKKGLLDRGWAESPDGKKKFKKFYFSQKYLNEIRERYETMETSEVYEASHQMTLLELSPITN